MEHRRLLASVFVIVLVAPAFVSVSGAQPESAVSVEGSEASAVGRQAVSRRREVPDAMVLCRGPRGAVYARDVNDGCRNTRLDASNLVDFGGGDDCILRRATAFDPDGVRTSSAQTCDDICGAADEDRSCVVALRRTKDAWATFSSSESFSSGADELRDAITVCCKR